MGAVASGGAVRVLVVEDDAFTRMTLATVVVSLGYVVVGQAGTVVEAMDSEHGSRLVAGIDVDKHSVCTSIGSNRVAVASLNPAWCGPFSPVFELRNEGAREGQQSRTTQLTQCLPT